MTSTKRKLLLVVFAVVLIVALFTAGAISALALTAGDTVEYPFAVGGGAFKYAPTWISDTNDPNAGDPYEFFSIAFESTSLADMDYFALQVKATRKSFGFTVGALATNGGGRLDTDGDGAAVDGNKCYLVREDGSIKELSILYASINLDKDESGMLLLPKDQLKWRWGEDTSINRYYFTTNTNFNYDFALTVGEIGYYTGDPSADGVYHSLWNPTLDASHSSYTQAEKDKYYISRGKMDFPMFGDYPFSENTSFFNKYAPTWKGATEQGDVLQTLKTPVGDGLDLTGVKSIAIQVKSTDTVGMIVAALNGSARKDTTASDGQIVSFVTADGQKSEIAIKDGGYIEFSGTGAIVIPVECLSGDLTALNQIVFEANAGNYHNFSIVIGEIGYYGTDDVYHAWHTIPDLAAENSTGLYVNLFVAENSTVVHPTAPESPLRGIEAKNTYGDVKVYWQADANNLASHSFYDKGASGAVEIAKDSYNVDALQVQATANNGDGYMAMDVVSAVIPAEGTRGITLWAKNPSDRELSFNVEVDVKYKQTDTAVRYQRTRMNIKQGNRFWLYDINTGKQTIYMTRPTASLPAHFEGWIRLPYACFNRADWSAGNISAMFDNGVAKADTFIAYVGVSYSTRDFPINQPFVINNFGTYDTTPLFNSVLVNNPTMTIPALMNNLPALPQVNEEV